MTYCRLSLAPLSIKDANLAPGERVETIKRALNVLLLAVVVGKVVHTPARGFPISASEDKDVFKVLRLDVSMTATEVFASVRSALLACLLVSEVDLCKVGRGQPHRATLDGAIS